MFFFSQLVLSESGLQGSHTDLWVWGNIWVANSIREGTGEEIGSGEEDWARKGEEWEWDRDRTLGCTTPLK